MEEQIELQFEMPEEHFDDQIPSESDNQPLE